MAVPALASTAGIAVPSAGLAGMLGLSGAQQPGTVAASGGTYTA